MKPSVERKRATMVIETASSFQPLEAVRVRHKSKAISVVRIVLDEDDPTDVSGVPLFATLPGSSTVACVKLSGASLFPKTRELSRVYSDVQPPKTSQKYSARVREPIIVTESKGMSKGKRKRAKPDQSQLRM